MRLALPLLVLISACGKVEDPHVDSSHLPGQCGAASGVLVSAAPTTDLCVLGVASTVSGDGPWAWSCTGPGGATSCSASVAGPEGEQLPAAGNPDGGCNALQLPASAQAVDTSAPDHVVGTGTPESCTAAALKAAVSQGGIITFDCGPGLVTIKLTEALTPPTSNAYANEAPVHTVIDGGRKVTLDGQRSTRIINWNHEGHWQKSDDTLTLQHLRLMNGKATGSDTFAACTQAPNDQCSTGFKDGQGGALFMRDGDLRVIDCTFTNNEAALIGPATGGGAIYVLGTAHDIQISGSTFSGNRASNAGGLGMLFSGALISNSLFIGNEAVGTGANSVDASHCACAGNQVGSGGNGGGLYKDGGDGQDIVVCGSQFTQNSAKEFGAAIFLTANGSAAHLVLYDTNVNDNTNGHPYWQWCASISTDTTGTSPQPVNSSFCQSDGTCSTSCG